MRPASPSSGGPNVGKSSLVNRLLREERVLVSDMPGTTRDAIDALLTWHRRRFRIVDTAGMRRAGAGRERREGRGGQRRRREEGDLRRRRRRAGHRRQHRARPTRTRRSAAKPTAPAAASSSSRTSGIWSRSAGQTYVDGVRRRDAAAHALSRLRADPAHLGADRRADAQGARDDRPGSRRSRRQRIPTPALNKFLEAVTAANPPVSPGRKHVRIMYAAQIGVMPPSFVFFTNVATTFHFSYERFLINQLREQFGFVGTPIRIQVRRRAKGGGPRKERNAGPRRKPRGPRARRSPKRREVRGRNRPGRPERS